MTDINEKSMIPENGKGEGKERSAELARLAITALEDKKAEDVRVIDIGGVSVLADYFIIASGNNRAQVQAMADEVEQRLGRAGAVPRQIEGYQAGNWVLMDFGDVTRTWRRLSGAGTRSSSGPALWGLQRIFSWPFSRRSSALCHIPLRSHSTQSTICPTRSRL